MPAILKVMPRYYSIEMGEYGKSSISQSGLGLHLWNNRAIILTGKEAGSQPAEPSVIKPGQVAAIDMGLLKLFKYPALISVNSDLFSVATVQAPTLIEPGSQNLYISIQAQKQVNLTDFEHLITLHIID